MKKYNPGEAMRNKANDNKEAIRSYFTRLPFHSQKDCAEALGLSPVTVSRHCIDLKKEYEGAQ